MVFPIGYNIVVWVLIEAVLLSLFGVILSIIYKESIQKLLYKIIDKVYVLLHKMWIRIENLLICVS